MRLKLISIILTLCIHSTAQDFTYIPSSQSNIRFNNKVNHSVSLNIFNYEYFTNGAGVAIGDINNDGLPDIYFSGNSEQNKLYLNKGNLVFEDITENAKVDGGGNYKTGVSMIDINNDGWLDIYVCKDALATPGQRVNVLYINNKNKTFTNKAMEYGLADSSYSTQAYWADLDLDGDVDMYLVNHPEKISEAKKINLTYDAKGNLYPKVNPQREYVSDRYYENINGKYIDHTLSAGLGNHAFGLSAIIDDFNNDDYPDIYVANDYSANDALYINNKNNTFTNKINEYFKHTSYSSMGSDFADIDNDGYSDLLVVDMLPEDNHRQKKLRQVLTYEQFDKMVKYKLGVQFIKNVLQVSDQAKSYSDISYYAGVAFTDWSWAPLIADFDNDGFKDIYITNGILYDFVDQDYMKYQADSVINSLKSLKESQQIENLVKIFTSTPITNYYYKNEKNNKFSNKTIESGLTKKSFSNGAAYADLDKDGDLDIIVNNVNEEAFIIQNNATIRKDANFVQLYSKDPNLLHSKFEIKTPDENIQYLTMNPYKGYLSSHEQLVHCGIGIHTTCEITWTVKNESHTWHQVKAGERILLDPRLLKATVKPQISSYKEYQNITSKLGINIKHEENEYIDYKLEPLLPKRLSQQGPCIAVADINGDHLDDFFIGGCMGKSGLFYIQKSNGTFAHLKSTALIEDQMYEDVNAQFFDGDLDGDQDLLIVSGGNDFGKDLMKYPVRYYINDGKGTFNRSRNFPKINVSGKAIAISDFDNDGDPDIFIGGRVMPGDYGLSPQSYLLQNNNGIFSTVNQGINAKRIGMITDALWHDFDEDGYKDLLVVGEWMPIAIYKNKAGILDSIPFEIKGTHGWWSCIYPADLNGDQKMDFICGNLGLNSRYKGSKIEPLSMHVADYDRNGSTDALINMYVDGKTYPIVNRDLLLDQIPALKKIFYRYELYADAQLLNFIPIEEIKSGNNYIATEMKNSMILNKGKANFDFKPLPNYMQLFPIRGISKNGNDYLFIGNDYSAEIETGRNDGCNGITATYLNNTWVNIRTYNGFEIGGDTRCILPIMINGEECWIVGRNNDKLEFFTRIHR
jgi:hypothetical protein